jgi:hypothetical protein
MKALGEEASLSDGAILLGTSGVYHCFEASSVISHIMEVLVSTLCW